MHNRAGIYKITCIPTIMWVCSSSNKLIKCKSNLNCVYHITIIIAFANCVCGYCQNSLDCVCYTHAKIIDIGTLQQLCN